MPECEWGEDPPSYMGGEVLKASPPIVLYMAKNSTKQASAPDMDDYRAESDHRTMMEAATIRGDGKRMSGVKRHHMKQRSVLGRVGRTLGGRR